MDNNLSLPPLKTKNPEEKPDSNQSINNKKTWIGGYLCIKKGFGTGPYT
jgi:hypothetical protein